MSKRTYPFANESQRTTKMKVSKDAELAGSVSNKYIFTTEKPCTSLLIPKGSDYPDNPVINKSSTTHAIELENRVTLGFPVKPEEACLNRPLMEIRHSRIQQDLFYS